MIRLNLSGEAWINSRRKHIVDLSLCLLLMPFSLCIATLSCLAVWLERSGPLLYTQHRIGRSGKKFTIHKFRTISKEPGTEPSITRVGELLNILGADETPQLLYTIWIGDMTTIGPRPLTEQDLTTMRSILGPERYAEWHHAYTLCRPGWMGPFSQPSRNFTPQSHEYLFARFYYDTAYLRYACFSLDLIILAQSLLMWCTRPAALWNAVVKLIPRPD